MNKNTKLLKAIAHSCFSMKKSPTVLLGLLLILAGALIYTYSSFTVAPPILTGNSQNTSIDYMAFFSIALGGAGALILLFGFWQWANKREPKKRR